MATKKLSPPQTLRAILITLLVVVILGGAGLFALGISEVRNFAFEVNHSAADAEASGKIVQNLQSLKSQLTQSEVLIAKANAMFATPENYQTQSITDIRAYADAAGLVITKTSFEEATAEAPATMVVSIQSPVSYTKLIQFLDSIEGNIPKMQVASIGVGHVTGSGADSVSIDDIKITTATR